MSKIKLSVYVILASDLFLHLPRIRFAFVGTACYLIVYQKIQEFYVIFNVNVCVGNSENTKE
jgi:hypothetical protein